MTEPGIPDAPEPLSEGASSCPWCAALNPADATRCGSCDAALAQRESIGDLRIPGLTAVDPALEDYDKRPLHLRGPSPSQGVAPALIVGALAGGPIGLVAIGGVAAVAGAEFLGSRAGGSGSTALGDVGKPSEVALRALEHLGEGGKQGAGAPEAAPARGPAAGAAGDGSSIWRDLPAQPDPEGGAER